MTNQRASLTAALMTFGMVLSGGGAPAATGPAHLLKEINSTPSFNRGSFPEGYGRLGSIAFFHAQTPQTGMELWRTDGTEAGTFLVKDIYPGPGGAFNYPGFYRPDDPFVELGGSLLFMADDGIHGFELWRTDGTDAGTRMVKEIRPGTGSPFDAEHGPESILHWEHIEIGGTMYFLADDGVHGFELYRTDGTDAGKLLRLPLGIETSLSAFLNAAARDLSANRIVPAILSLEAFGMHLDALSPGKVSEASAADLQEFTSEIVTLLEGSLKPAVP